LRDYYNYSSSWKRLSFDKTGHQDTLRVPLDWDCVVTVVDFASRSVLPKLNPDLEDEAVSVQLLRLSRITYTESGDPERNVNWIRNGTYFVNNNTSGINKLLLKMLTTMDALLKIGQEKSTHLFELTSQIT